MKRLFGLCLVLVLGSFGLAHAQSAKEADILLTWHPVVYTPAGYAGHALPTANSRIVASVAVIDNGRLIDIAGQTIYWYLNDEFIEGAAGKQTIEFRAPNEQNQRLDLRVEVPSYKDGVLKTVEIPSLQPLVVIEAPFPHATISDNKFNVRALPYFFNVPKLSYLRFSWTAEARDVTSTGGAPSTLAINVLPGTAAGYTFPLGVSVTNPLAGVGNEVAAGGANIVFAP